VPIKFVGIGEKTDALEPFYPDRLASRILGMGDVISLIEKAELATNIDKTKELERKIRHGSFDLDDFLEQLRQIRKMGPLAQVMEMIPGFSGIARKLPAGLDEKQPKKIEAIILSMTPEERHNPNIIDGSRRRRIARGSGTTPQDVNQLLNQHRQMQKLMKQMNKGQKLSSLFKLG
jgi:signal recognition particle subunit SRP54